MDDEWWTAEESVPAESPTPQPPAAPSATPRRGPSLALTAAVAAVVALVVGALAGLGGFAIGRQVDAAARADRAATAATTTVAVAGTSPQAGSIAAIADATLPAVVSIVAEGTSEAGSGSGFVIRADGYVVTNNHVVALVSDGGNLTVVFNDGRRLKGTVVGTNASYDLAVVHVADKGLPTLSLGESSAVRVGDAAIAIGAPLGLDGTVTSGIISAVDRPVTAGGTDGSTETSYINAIQTDAAINPGNSGGPLLDGRGRVIGVNSAIATLASGTEAGSIGLGFAIPSDSAKRVVEELIDTGTSRTPLMGVQLDMAYDDGGARVTEVTKGSPADTAGIEPGDVIMTLDERQIDDGTELVVAVRTHAPGEQVEVGFVRDGTNKTVSVVLGDDSADE